MKTYYLKTLIVIVSAVILTACTGDKTFNDYARAGDTVILACGWKSNFNKGNISVSITPSVGDIIDILPGDPSIRAVVNVYPDPVSSAVVSRETGKDQTLFAQLYGNIINDITDNDKDWYQTTVALDLPATLPEGTTSITITNTQGDSSTSTVEIIPGTGSPHTFTANSSTSISPLMFLSMQRTNNYVVSFEAASIPYAIEVTLTHDPDIDSGGIGNAFAINPLGYKKNLAWNDDGTTMKVILTPASTSSIDNMHDFKFYVAGGIQNLTINNIKSYDIDGNLFSGTVTGSIQLYDI